MILKREGEGEGEKTRLGIGNDPLGRMYVFFLFLPFIISVMMRTHQELFSPISLPSLHPPWKEKTRKEPKNLTISAKVND